MELLSKQRENVQRSTVRNTEACLANRTSEAQQSSETSLTVLTEIFKNSQTDSYARGVHPRLLVYSVVWVGRTVWVCDSQMLLILRRGVVISAR